VVASVYPQVGFHFVVAIGGMSAADASFAEVSGLDVERNTIDVFEGGENRFVWKLPDRSRQANIVLKRGLVNEGTLLFAWCKRSLERDLGSAALETRDIDVSLLDESGAPVITWNVPRAWPVKWSVAPFNAVESSVAVETLEFAAGGAVSRAYGGAGAGGLLGLLFG